MAFSDFHTHTVYSDGKHTPEEMVLAAIEKGMDAIGFSEHSWVGFDPEPNMPIEKISAYQAEIRALQEKYRNQIRILCGIEQDYYTEQEAAGFDFIIGSVHYVCNNGIHIAVDDTPEILRRGIDEQFSGDVYALTDAYWSNVADVVRKTHCNLIGHLDLIRKFNRDGAFFDETNPRYQDAAVHAVDTLLETGVPFEINTGAISRGYQELPYPAPWLIEYIHSKGGQFLLSSDSHRKDTLCFRFEEWKKWGNATL